MSFRTPFLKWSHSILHVLRDCIPKPPEEWALPPQLERSSQKLNNRKRVRRSFCWVKSTCYLKIKINDIYGHIYRASCGFFPCLCVYIYSLNRGDRLSLARGVQKTAHQCHWDLHHKHAITPTKSESRSNVSGVASWDASLSQSLRISKSELHNAPGQERGEGERCNVDCWWYITHILKSLLSCQRGRFIYLCDQLPTLLVKWFRFGPEKNANSVGQSEEKQDVNANVSLNMTPATKSVAFFKPGVVFRSKNWTGPNYRPHTWNMVVIYNGMNIVFALAMCAGLCCRHVKTWDVLAQSLHFFQ